MKTRKSVKFSRNAQLYSQIFIYILTVVLIAFIFVYGYNSIQNFTRRADQLSCIKFRNDLQVSVESILGDFGTVKRKDFQLCNQYTKVCFVESVTNRIIPPNTDPIIRDSILSNAGKNVFLVENIAKESFYAGKISVEPDVLCILAPSNKISLKLESKGNSVLLSQWS